MTSLATPPTASTPPEPPELSETYRWWNGFHVAAAVFLGAYAIYALIVVGRLTRGNPAANSNLPALLPLHAIIVPTLVLAVVLAFIAAGRRHDRAERERREAAWCKAWKERWRVEDARWREQGEWMGMVMETLTALKERPVGRSDTTQDLGGHRGVYASFAAFQSGPFDGVLASLRAQVDQRVDAAIGERVSEYGNQRWYAGYAAGREDTSGGSVVALQPRNGQRSS